MKFIAEFVRILNFLPIFIAIFHKPYGDVLYCTARFFRPAVSGGRIGPAARGVDRGRAGAGLLRQFGVPRLP